MLRKSSKMFDKAKQCKLTHKVLTKFDNFLYVFNLRQGTILIAIHQIALSLIVLIVLLVGATHLSEMVSIIRKDMMDNEERRGFYEVHGEHMRFQEHEPGVARTNNMKRFEKARDIATWSLVVLFTIVCITTLYLMSSISLLHGAIKSKPEFIVPWIIAACIGVVLLIVTMVICDDVAFVIELFGGHSIYHFFCTMIVISCIYTLFAVSSFVLKTEPSKPSVRATHVANDESGERLLLLDHSAHISLLSAAQLSKLTSNGTLTQFV